MSKGLAKYNSSDAVTVVTYIVCCFKFIVWKVFKEIVKTVSLCLECSYQLRLGFHSPSDAG